MTQPVSVDLLVEDVLSEAAATRAVAASMSPLVVGVTHGKQGFGYIKKRIAAFNRAALGSPYFALTDLDEAPCAPGLIQDWLPETPSPNLLFRVAGREVESWLLADRDRFASFIGRPSSQLPPDADAEPDPKAKIISLARRSSKRRIREGVPPRPGTSARIGPAYNDILTQFVYDQWEPREAVNRSDSLKRCIAARDSFPLTT